MGSAMADTQICRRENDEVAAEEVLAALVLGCRRPTRHKTARQILFCDSGNNMPMRLLPRVGE